MEYVIILLIISVVANIVQYNKQGKLKKEIKRLDTFRPERPEPVKTPPGYTPPAEPPLNSPGDNELEPSPDNPDQNPKPPRREPLPKLEDFPSGSN